MSTEASNVHSLCTRSNFFFLTDDAHKSSVALQVLPCILPTGQVKNRNGKTTRASTSEALAAFIDCEPVSCVMQLCQCITMSKTV